MTQRLQDNLYQCQLKQLQIAPTMRKPVVWERVHRFSYPPGASSLQSP